MNISVLGIVFGLLLLAIPLYAIYYFRLRLLHRFAVVVGRMIVGVAVMGGIIYGALRLNSIVYDVTVFLLLTIVSCILTLGKARLHVGKLLVPVGIGSILAVAIVGFYFLFLVLGETNPFLPHLFIPLMGIVAGGMIHSNASAMQSYYSGLLYHGQLYNYIIGNGGTHREATRFFVRRGIQTAIISVTKQMSQVVFSSAPVVMFVLVMGGTDVLTASAFQVLAYVAVLSASLLSLFIAIFLGRKYSFDEYERLKPVFKDVKAEVTAPDDTVSDSSSSPSELPHTDSVSLQPEE